VLRKLEKTAGAYVPMRIPQHDGLGCQAVADMGNRRTLGTLNKQAFVVYAPKIPSVTSADLTMSVIHFDLARAMHIHSPG
jgi:hypothetical protein